MALISKIRASESCRHLPNFCSLSRSLEILPVFTSPPHEDATLEHYGVNKRLLNQVLHPQIQIFTQNLIDCSLYAPVVLKSTCHLTQMKLTEKNISEQQKVLP